MNTCSGSIDNNMLRIGMFCSQYKPIVGGSERQAEKLGKALVRKGAVVKMLTPKIDPGSPENEIDDGMTIIRFPLFDIYKHIPKIRGFGPLNLMSIGIQIQRAINYHIRKFDILHCHLGSPQTAFAMLAAQKMGIPVVCKIGVAGDQSDIVATGSIGLGGKTLARKLVRRMNLWVATTSAVKDALLQSAVPSDRIVSIPNGVDFLDKQSPPRNDEFVKRFLSLGRLAKNINRDVFTLIKAFRRLAEEVNGLELAIVGDGDLYENTRDFVAANKCSDKVKLPGFQESQPWLDWADCFVLPSRREGLSNALLEAMAEGLPCIANDILPNREVLDDARAGILVPVGDVDTLYSAMKVLATTKGEAKRWGDLARARVELKYTIDSVADRYLETYRALIQHHHSRQTRADYGPP